MAKRHPTPSSEPDLRHDPFGVEDIMKKHPDWEAIPAICHHRCDCECHSNPNIVHCGPCCTGCGHGHTQILHVYLYAHLKACHGIEKP